MKLPEDVAIWLQGRIAMMSTDDMSALAFSSGRIESCPDDTIARWQLAVDMIHRCVVSGVLEINPALTDFVMAEGLQAATREMAMVDPFKFPGDAGAQLIWLGSYLYCTSHFRLRVAHYGLLDADEADAIAQSCLYVLGHPKDYPAYVAKQAEQRQKADHYFECARVSRDAGWVKGKDITVLNPDFIEEIEGLCEAHGVPWASAPIIPVVPGP
ncbi:hypothetical protein SAMN04487785_115146 [Dyella jiangningensis]|uniref:hypothetical protein n=1 Tax=Dyella sp. AtDHG13 TaxID=1938897 RepID=UPI000884AEFA|nr:hypothetical protein [Dyella sp. AtDHG13]PXV58497.1 hypothetical protein BDW41_1052 [Dyella sp. AtDHG13]SDL18047.1 hypothetical protein SAMN04487785_115146 [Dyella jiangningensis]